MENRPITVIGAGGHSSVVVATILAAGGKVRHVLDDDRERWGKNVCGVLVRGPIPQRNEEIEAPAFLALGDNATRRRFAERIQEYFPAVVHPTAWVDPTAQIGEGTLVCAGAVIQPYARIGRHVIVNTGANGRSPQSDRRFCPHRAGVSPRRFR